MRKIFALFVSLILIFTMSCPIAFAEDDTATIPADSSTATEVQPTPEVPIITDDMSEDEANQLIDNYNQGVDEYNNYVTEENTRIETEYNQQVAEIDAHNAEEQSKVEQNQKDLENWNKKQDRIAADSQSQLQNQTTNFEDLPSSWDEEKAENPTTVTVEKKDSNEQYDITNLHIYLNKDVETYTGSSINDKTFHINMNAEDLLLGEWETISAGDNDIVTVYSESKLYPNSGALFRRQLEGFTNGYWIPTQELVSTVRHTEENWTEEGPSTSFSYDEGTTDHQPIKNILNLYVYNFLRYGDEPVAVAEYVPNFQAYPEKPTLLEYLNRMEHITREPSIIIIPDPDPTPEKPEPTPEPTPDPVPEKPEPKPEKPETDPEKPEPKPEKPEPEKPTSEPETDPALPTPQPSKPEEDKPQPVQPEDTTKPVEPEAVETVLPDTEEVPELPILRTVINVPLPAARVETATPVQNLLELTPINSTVTTPMTRRVTTIETEPVKKVEVERTVPIKDDKVPLAKNRSNYETWALLNLIFMIINIILAIKIPKETDEDQKDVKHHSNIASIIFALGATLLFIFTENVRLPMVLIDNWTLAMFVVMLCGVGGKFLARDEKIDKDEQ